MAEYEGVVGEDAEAPAGGAARRILVVSNRLPFTFHNGPGGLERQQSSGGLVSALDPVLRRNGGTWVGWAGADISPEAMVARPEDAYDLRFVGLRSSEVTGYYHGFSNRTLWPLFHSFPGRTRFDRREWRIYDQVNQRFAEVAADTSRENDLIWVHDYHLMRCPRYLRGRVREARIAFFLHIPFPPYDIFRLLPWDRELLRGLLACDLVGFHVAVYASNFFDSVERLLGARVDREAMLIEHGDRVVKVGVFPIGIDFARYETYARETPGGRGRRESVVLGVDRLDYTKGIPERILAFERLLDLYPEHREKVVLMQLAVPSRSQVQEYRDLKRKIDELVGRVNGRFATATWSPISYLYQLFPPDRLSTLYRDSDVALVTPLRDGMNLVAKEFIACQVDEPGVLILSRLAGAAQTMREAIQVNPYDIDGTAEALHRALLMDETERRSRLAALRRRERRRDVYAWLDAFLQAACATPRGLRPPTDREFESWFGGARFFAGHKVALFLDYDGTLAPICAHPAEAFISPSMRKWLDVCAARDDTEIAIVSGRALADVKGMVGHTDLTYAGSHGLEIHFPDLPEFQHEDLAHYAAKCDSLARELNERAPPGGWTERKGATLTFHYRQVEPAEAEKAAARARRLIQDAGFQTRDAHSAVEAMPPIPWDKGRAVLHILRSRFGPDWPERVRAVYVGDDRTDEDAFRVLAGLGITIRVGSADTATVASRRLANVDAVGALLRWLATRPEIDMEGEWGRRG